MTDQLHLLDYIAAAQERDRALDLLEATRPWVQRAREAAIALWSKSHQPITVNDVREICPAPEDIDPRVFGAVFRPPEWRAVGYVQSGRKRCHARPIRQFIRTV